MKHSGMIVQDKRDHHEGGSCEFKSIILMKDTFQFIPSHSHPQLLQFYKAKFVLLYECQEFISASHSFLMKTMMDDHWVVSCQEEFVLQEKETKKPT